MDVGWVKRFRGEWSQDVSPHFHGAKRLWDIAHGANCPVRGGTSMGRTVNGATSPDTPQRRNSIVKHVFRHDKSSFAVFRRLLGIYTDRWVCVVEWCVSVCLVT